MPFQIQMNSRKVLHRLKRIRGNIDLGCFDGPSVNLPLWSLAQCM